MTRKTKNILFIMFDQLRFDYLGCAGHPHLKTPHIDRLAARGVRFNRAYVQSTVCGASRMSFYTGRYVHSHGAAWNNFPLKVGEMTMGDHLRDAGMDAYLVGKTHMSVDQRGMDRLGISRDSIIGARVSECGFDIEVRDDGLWAHGRDGYYDERRSPYNEYLKSKGYEAENPWHDYANSGVSDDDDVASGWMMTNANMPANIREEDSETPWLTDRAIDFMSARANDEKPWLCHLSYIKPHWPYIVPAPYHNMYGHNQVLPVVRHPNERQGAHPVYDAFMDSQVSKSFQRDEVRQKVIPAYMGLIKQCDDQMGRLFDWMEKVGRMNDTMIVITSDHGDYLGDHWMGEKDLFHDCSVRVPMILYDPSTKADASRGLVCEELVEAIDLAPTFVEAAGGKVAGHILEGHSLLPIVYSQDKHWREYAVSEYDYSVTRAAGALGVKSADARLFMIVDNKWKFVHAEGGFRPMLFDLANDPRELVDLGSEPDSEEIISLMYERLGKWARRMSQRTTVSDAEIDNRKNSSGGKGVLIGLYEGGEIEPVEMIKYQGKVPKRYVPDE